MSQPIRGQGGHLVFQIGPKNTNLVEDVEFLLPIKFRWILFSGFRGEVENVKSYDGRTDDRRTMDDGQRVITIVHLSLQVYIELNSDQTIDNFQNISQYFIKKELLVRLGYCFTPYQRLWLYNGTPLGTISLILIQIM